MKLWRSRWWRQATGLGRYALLTALLSTTLLVIGLVGNATDAVDQFAVTLAIVFGIIGIAAALGMAAVVALIPSLRFAPRPQLGRRRLRIEVTAIIAFTLAAALLEVPILAVFLIGFVLFLLLAVFEIARDARKERTN